MLSEEDQWAEGRDSEATLHPRQELALRSCLESDVFYSMHTGHNYGITELDTI